MSGRLAVGCHLSTSGGYERMGRTAVDLDATTLAFFTRNPRGGGSKALDGQDVARLCDVLAAHGFGRLVAHAPYTMNLCSGNPETVAFARRTLADDLERMEVLPGNYYNLHPGSHVGQGVDRGIGLICEGLDATLEPGQATMVLLETMAGKGSEVGRSFEELARILDGTRHDELLGICLDTCHVSDAGYDVAGDLEGVLGEFDRLIGLERLRALHLNDSKSPCGSRRDRHERLGAGHLGINCFAAIVAHPLLSTLPMVLETPNDLAGYAAEIALLRSLAGEREA